MRILPIYIIGTFLFFLILPNINGESQILPQNLSISIQGFGNCSDTRLNITLSTLGGIPINYINIPGCSNINEIKQVLFIGELGDCNQSLTTQLFENCNNYFNESCDGFPCQSSWLVCKDDLNRSNAELNLYKSNSSDISLMIGNLTNCYNQIVAKENEASSCRTLSSSNADLIEKSKKKVDTIWLFVVGIGALVLGYIIWNKGKVIKNMFSKTNEMNFSGKRVLPDGTIMEK